MRVRSPPPCGRRPARGARARGGRVVPARDRVVDRQDRAAGQAEDDVDALGLERAQDRVGSVHPSSLGELHVGAGRRHQREHRVDEVPRRRRRAVAVDVGGAQPAGERVPTSPARASGAAARSPRPSPSISEAASSIPLGLATPCPAMSGAEPCVGPNTPGPVGDSRPRGDDPSPVPRCGGEVGDELREHGLRDDRRRTGPRRRPSDRAARGSASLARRCTPGCCSASVRDELVPGAALPDGVEARAARRGASSKARATANGSASSSSGLTIARSRRRAAGRAGRASVRSSSAFTPSSAGSSACSATSTASARRHAARVDGGSGWP